MSSQKLKFDSNNFFIEISYISGKEARIYAHTRFLWSRKGHGVVSIDDHQPHRNIRPSWNSCRSTKNSRAKTRTGVRVKLTFIHALPPTRGRGNVTAIVIRNEAVARVKIWMESWKEQDARGECKSIELPAIRRDTRDTRPLVPPWKLPIKVEIVYTKRGFLRNWNVSSSSNWDPIQLLVSPCVKGESDSAITRLFPHPFHSHNVISSWKVSINWRVNRNVSIRGIFSRLILNYLSHVYFKFVLLDFARWW